MSEKEQKIVADITADFKKRQEARRAVELNWRLNMNFVVGNQFAQISSKGDIEEQGKEYFWQEREVFNHIAPILETRLAKLGRVKAKAQVRPATADDDDVASAALASKLIDAVCKENDFSSQLALANTWSEITGSAFFKITWDAQKGHSLDADGNVKEGDVTIALCPPFEIFPEDIAITDIDKQSSIIHAKVLTEQEVKSIWGRNVKGGEVNVFSFDNADVGGGLGYTASIPKIVSEKKENAVVVIEKYEKPTSDCPNGRLTIVAGDTLIFRGDMPYLNGEDGQRGYPFAKMTCIDNLTNFFGTSVVERIIPVQRAYNTVKNRKHEYMNRMAVGVFAVEDGSVDTDDLQEEGLPPGKVVVYRQGSTPPRVISPTHVPSEFSQEEEKLLNEFVMISGVSDVFASACKRGVGHGNFSAFGARRHENRTHRGQLERVYKTHRQARVATLSSVCQSAESEAYHGRKRRGGNRILLRREHRQRGHSFRHDKRHRGHAVGKTRNGV